MRNGSMKHVGIKIVSIVVLTAFILTGFVTGTSKGINYSHSSDDSTIYTISFTYNFAKPSTVKSGQLDNAIINGLDSGGSPGCPALPEKSITLLLPFGYKYCSMTVTGNYMMLPGKYNIRPVPIAVSLSYDNPSPTLPKSDIYTSTTPYPSLLYTSPTISGFRGFTLLYANLNPVQYVPSTGTLLYYTSLYVTVNMVPGTTEFSKLYRGIPTDFSEVAKMIDNPSTVSSYPSRPVPYGSYELLLITSSALQSSFQKLVDYKNNNSVPTKLVTVEAITATMTGNDTQEKIRNYIIKEYQNNSITDVILGGDNLIIPLRGLYCDAGSGLVDNIPSDWYFEGLDGTWISGSGQWGGPGSEDWTAEVYAGRLLCDKAADVTIIVNKIISFESTPRSKDITFHGTFAESGGSTPMSAIKEGDSQYPQGAHAYIPSSYTVHTLYETGSNTITQTLWEAEFKAGREIINHGSHGAWNEYYISFDPTIVTYTATQALAIINTYYPVQATVACEVGGYDQANPCMAGAYLIAPKGGCSACVMNTRDGLYGGTNDAVTYSGQLDIDFYKQIFTNKYLLGQAVQMAKQDYVSKVTNDSAYKWILYEWSLFGDPTADINGGMALKVTSPASGNVWNANSIHAITWTTSGGIGTKTVALSYSTSSATGPWTSITASTPDNSSYEWTVPNAMSTTCYILATVTDSSTPAQSANGTSGKFTINQPFTVTLTSPIGGELWVGGSVHPVTWTTSGGTNLNISIAYSTNSGSVYSTFATNQPNTGTYSWTLPLINNKNVRIQITATDSLSVKVSSASQSDFTIESASPTVKVTAPVANAIWIEGTHRITWTISEPLGLTDNCINVSYSPDNTTWTSLVSNGASSLRYYDWSIAKDTVNSAYVSVKVTAYNNISKSGTGTSSLFTVDTSSPVIIHTPIVNIVLNQKQTVSASITDSVKLQSAILYYTNVGASAFNQVTMSVSSGTTYTADIPAQSITGTLKYHIIATDTAEHWAIAPVSTQSPSNDLNWTVTIKTDANLATISGTVRNVVGSPIAGAMVTALISGVSGGSASTDSSGAYTVNGLNPGKYDLVANATGYIDGKIPNVTVVAMDKLTGKDFTLMKSGTSNKRTIMGHVVTESDNSALVGATVQLLSAAGAQIASMQTLANGSFFKFVNLDPGPYTLIASDSGYKNTSQDVDLSQTSNNNVVLTLPAVDTSHNNNLNLPPILGLPFMTAILLFVIFLIIIIAMVAALAASRRRKKDKGPQQFAPTYPPPPPTPYYMNTYPPPPPPP